MAQSIVSSLFGVPVDPIERIRMTEARGPEQAISGLISGQGASLRQNVNRMFGVVPPQEKLQQIIQQASQQVDLGTPEGMSRLADALAQHPEFAGMSMGLKQEANNMRMKQAEFGATQELGKARLDLTKAQTEFYGRRGTEKTSTEKGRQVQELIDMGTPQEEAVRMVYGSAKEANVSEQVKKAKFEEFQKRFPNDPGRVADEFKKWETTFAKEVAGAGKPDISPTERAILPGKAKILESVETGALQASNTNATADAINNVLNNAFTGFGTDAKLKAAQIAQAFGVTVTGTSETEQLKQLLAKLAQGQARTLPGALSEKELMFLREAIGTPGFTVQTLRNVVDRMKTDARAAEIENEQVQQFTSGGGNLNNYNFVSERKKAIEQAKKEIEDKQSKMRRLEELRRKQRGQ